MALSSVIGVLFSLWTVADACTSLTLSDQMPSDVSAYLNDDAIYPLKVYLAYEPLDDQDTAAKISCYSFDKDFKVTAYDGTTGLQTFNATPTAKVVTTTDAKVTYTITTQSFMGANTAGDTVTLHLQGVVNDLSMWEGCSATEYQSNWIMLKNSGSLDNVEEYCLRNVLENKFEIDSTDWGRKGFC